MFFSECLTSYDSVKKAWSSYPFCYIGFASSCFDIRLFLILLCRSPFISAIDLAGIFYSVALESHISTVDGLSSRLEDLISLALVLDDNTAEVNLYNISHNVAVTGWVGNILFKWVLLTCPLSLSLSYWYEYYSYMNFELMLSSCSVNDLAKNSF